MPPEGLAKAKNLTTPNASTMDLGIWLATTWEQPFMCHPNNNEKILSTPLFPTIPYHPPSFPTIFVVTHLHHCHSTIPNHQLVIHCYFTHYCPLLWPFPPPLHHVHVSLICHHPHFFQGSILPPSFIPNMAWPFSNYEWAQVIQHIVLFMCDFCHPCNQGSNFDDTKFTI